MYGELWILLSVVSVFFVLGESVCCFFCSIFSKDLWKGLSFVFLVKYFLIVFLSNERILLWIKDSVVCIFVYKVEILEEFVWIFGFVWLVVFFKFVYEYSFVNVIKSFFFKSR